MPPQSQYRMQGSECFSGFVLSSISIEVSQSADHMFHWRTVAFLVILLQVIWTPSQSPTPKIARVQLTSRADSSDATLPKWLPFPIPPPLYEKWRKFGQSDYKQRGFKYRDYTLFNFGATGAAAGLDEESLTKLTQAAASSSIDFNRTDEPELKANFTRDNDSLERLRSMAEQDVRVIRIAGHFTWLDSSTEWPRAEIGFNEARWNEYRSLFTKLSLSDGIVRTEDFPGALFFVARANGLCTAGASAGYVYSANSLTPAVKSLQESLVKEARTNPSQHYAYVFEPLKKNWYAFYEIDW